MYQDDPTLNDNELVDPNNPYSPTFKEVREYVAMGYSWSGAVSSLTTTKRDRAEQEEEEDWPDHHFEDEDDEEEEIAKLLSFMLGVNIVVRPHETDSGSPGYRSPQGFHKHKCDCGYVWEHSDHCRGISYHHKCPSCSTIQWAQYSGPESPTPK